MNLAEDAFRGYADMDGTGPTSLGGAIARGPRLRAKVVDREGQRALLRVAFVPVARGVAAGAGVRDRGRRRRAGRALGKPTASCCASACSWPRPTTTGSRSSSASSLIASGPARRVRSSRPPPTRSERGRRSRGQQPPSGCRTPPGAALPGAAVGLPPRASAGCAGSSGSLARSARGPPRLGAARAGARGLRPGAPRERLPRPDRDHADGLPSAAAGRASGRLTWAPSRSRSAGWCGRCGSSAADLPPGRERVIPRGTVVLTVNLAADELRVYDSLDGAASPVGAARSSPARAQPRRHRPRGAAPPADVAFEPGGAAAFIRMPISELADASVELGELWGPAGASLRERILEQPSDAERCALVERFLVERLDPSRVPRVSAPAAAASRGEPGRRDGRAALASERGLRAASARRSDCRRSATRGSAVPAAARRARRRRRAGLGAARVRPRLRRPGDLAREFRTWPGSRRPRTTAQRHRSRRLTEFSKTRADALRYGHGMRSFRPLPPASSRCALTSLASAGAARQAKAEAEATRAREGLKVTATPPRPRLARDADCRHLARCGSPTTEHAASSDRHAHERGDDADRRHEQRRTALRPLRPVARRLRLRLDRGRLRPVVRRVDPATGKVTADRRAPVPPLPDRGARRQAVALRGLSDNVLEVIRRPLLRPQHLDRRERPRRGSQASAATTRRACGPTTPTGRRSSRSTRSTAPSSTRSLSRRATRGGSASSAPSSAPPASARCGRSTSCAARSSGSTRRRRRSPRGLIRSATTPSGIATGGGSVWVVDDSYLLRISPQTNKVTGWVRFERSDTMNFTGVTWMDGAAPVVNSPPQPGVPDRPASPR